MEFVATRRLSFLFHRPRLSVYLLVLPSFVRRALFDEEQEKGGCRFEFGFDKDQQPIRMFSGWATRCRRGYFSSSQTLLRKKGCRRELHSQELRLLKAQISISFAATPRGRIGQPYELSTPVTNEIELSPRDLNQRRESDGVFLIANDVHDDCWKADNEEQRA